METKEVKLKRLIDKRVSAPEPRNGSAVGTKQPALPQRLAGLEPRTTTSVDEEVLEGLRENVARLNERLERLAKLLPPETSKKMADSAFVCLELLKILLALMIFCFAIQGTANFLFAAVLCGVFFYFWYFSEVL